MPGPRYVVVGLARAQARWFLDTARWSNSGALPAEFVKALSVEELRARLLSGRQFSALLLDASLPGCDRDLLQLARDGDCAVVVVDDRQGHDHWHQLGAAAVLGPDFGRDDLVTTLRAVARTVHHGEGMPSGEPAAAEVVTGRWRGRMVAVTGSGGTGRSVVAMALAAGLARDPRDQGLVVLADLALRAQQGLLHDAGDVVPSLSELVDAHRTRRLAPADIRDLCFQVGERSYDVLLGLRRQRDWVSVRRRTLVAGLDGLRQTYRWVVADCDADVEGEAECGAVEIEERNVLARTSLTTADLVVVVGLAGMTGVHSHVQVLRDLLRLGVESERVLPVVNRAPRNPRMRAELGRALTRLLTNVGVSGDLASSPLFVPERRHLDEFVRDEARVPTLLGTALADPVRALLERLPPSEQTEGDGLTSVGEPCPVTPGSLGNWSALSQEPAS